MVVFTLALFLVVFYAGYQLAKWLERQWGRRWEIAGLDDWASLPLLWLVFSQILFFCSPVLNTYHRYQERQADNYALRLVHGLIPDSGQVAAQSFETLGEEWLEYPQMNHFFVIWMSDHPPVSDRIRLALSDDSYPE